MAQTERPSERDTVRPYRGSTPWLVAAAAPFLLALGFLRAALSEAISAIFATGPGIFGGATVVGDLLILLGIIVLVVAMIMILALKGAARHAGGGAVALAFVLIVVGVLYNGATPSSSLTSAPPGAAITSYIQSSALPTGCSVNTITNTELCTGVFNTNASGSGGGYYVTNANTTILGNKPNYIVFQIHTARTDAINSTYGFTYSVASISTLNTITSAPVTYSPLVGYVPATSTQTGYWKVSPTKGSAASQNPTVAAPATATNVQSDTVGIAAFGSATVAYDLSLPGGNSTYLPPFVNGAQGNLYNLYAFVVTVGGQTFTLDYEVIGFPA